MTKILTLDEMRELIARDDPDTADHLANILKSVGDLMVHIICKRHNVASSARLCTVEEAELGGTAAPFYRLTADQPTPEAFEYYDQGEPLDCIGDAP